MRGSWLMGVALVGVMLAGCSADPEGAAPDASAASSTSAAPDGNRTSTQAAPPPPVLYLNVTLGNATVAFSSTDAASGNATQVVGTGPINATFELGASGLPAAGNATWTLTFSSAGNASDGNASADGPSAGTALPATVHRSFSGNRSVNVTFSLKAGSAAAQRLDATVVIRSGSATVEARPTVVLFTTQFSGSLPLDGLEGAHPFEVPSGATRVDVLYTSDHVGLFTALASVSDPGGERITSSDACGLGSSGVATDTCRMTVEEDVGPGGWSASVFYQAGQATEDYTLDVTVSGYA